MSASAFAAYDADVLRRAALILTALTVTVAPLRLHAQDVARSAAPTERVLGNLSPERVRALMEEFNRALGVACQHCHVADRWMDESKPAFGVARNMIRMVGALNGEQLKDVGEIACWSCHGGAIHPSRLPRPSLDAELARWPENLSSVPESVRLAMAVYNVSLGVSCDHCHSADWKRDDKAPMRMVPRMNAMFQEFPKYMPATARTQCWMCHKGAKRPFIS